MDCPVCKEAMVTCQLDEVEVDYCINCSGIWLDKGELEILLGHSEKAETLLNSFEILTDYKEKHRKCPICLKKMHKILVSSSQQPLVIDKCTKDHGLWFDKGELQEVIKRGCFDSENKIQKLLAEIFGR